MKRLLSSLVLSILLASGGAAATLTYVAHLDGPSENPANPSLGVGTATLIVDTTANSASLDVTFGGLSSITQAAHIHCCVAPPTNSGIAVGSTGFPTGVPQGTFHADYDLLNSAIYSAPFLASSGGTAAGAMAALLAGLAGGQVYYNIHTVESPGGEIRGYFALPEPGIAALLGAGVLLALPARRRLARR